MRFLIAMLLVLAWLPATNACALATLLPQAFTHCCDDDGDVSKGVPCSNGCAKCVTLENGTDLSALQVLTADVPEWREDAMLSEWLRAAFAWVERHVQEVVRDVPPDDRPPWPALIRIAPPVRGPSLPA